MLQIQYSLTVNICQKGVHGKSMDVNVRRVHIPAPALTDGVTLGLGEQNAVGSGECVWNSTDCSGVQPGYFLQTCAIASCSVAP